MSDNAEFPLVLERQILARSRFFTIEGLHLKFDNGEERHYERLKSGDRSAVIVVPMLADGRFILVREYAAGLESYDWGLPKGLVEANEDIALAANRELMEEIAMAAGRIDYIQVLSTASGYLSHQIHVLLARDLHPGSLPGDEPEPLLQMAVSFEQLFDLVTALPLTESRTLAALFAVRLWLERQEITQEQLK